LTAEQLQECRQLGVRLAYDPLQIGWVTEHCLDDFGSEPVYSATPEHSSAQLHEAANRLFDVRSRALLRRREASSEAELWRLPQQIVQTLETPRRSRVRREILLDLQQRAAQRIATHLTDDTQRSRFRRTCRIPEHIVLRRWREADLPRFRALLDDPEVWRHLPEPYPDPLDDASARALLRLAGVAERHEVRAIVHNGTIVGQIRLEFGKRRATGDAEPEISYWIGRDSWGQGILGAVLPGFTLQAFERHRPTAICARVADANTASWRALERARFRYAGELLAEYDGEPAVRRYRAFRCDYPGDRPPRPAPAHRGASAQ
jgi:RimJ/RimL family protein N-acetyltransferase